MKPILLLLLAGAFLIGCDSNSLTFEDEAMNGTFETTFEMMPLEVHPDTGMPLRADIVVQGTGHVNLFGEVGVVITMPNVDLTVVPATATSMMVMTDQDGDTIMCRGTTTQSPPGQDGRFTFTSTDTITEGTGKYDGATGSGTTTGHGNVFTSTGSFTLSGTVSY